MIYDNNDSRVDYDDDDFPFFTNFPHVHIKKDKNFHRKRKIHNTHA